MQQQPQGQSMRPYYDPLNNDDEASQGKDYAPTYDDDSNSKYSRGGGGSSSYYGAPVVQALSSAASASGSYSQLPTSHFGGDRNRVADNVASLRSYTLFMYALITLSLLCMAVSYTFMRSSSAVGIANASSAHWIVNLVLAICIVSVLFTLQLTRWIFRKDDNNPAMRVISEAIREGQHHSVHVHVRVRVYVGVPVCAQ